MRRRQFLSLFISLILIFICCGIRPELPSPEKQTIVTTARYRLVWNDDPTTTMTIAWDQLSGSDPMVYYGTEDRGQKWKKYPHSQKPARTTPGYRSMNTHFAKLTGLKPDQGYYFVIKDNQSISKRYWFRTAPDKPKPFTFISGGDTKSEGTALEAGRASNRMVAKLRPLCIIFNGDYITGDGTNDEWWKQWLDDWSNLTTTKDGRMFPIIPIHGNHENGDKTVLNKLFDAPYQFGVEENIYYSLSFGGNFFHIIALNSEIEEGSGQRAWLENDLKTHQYYTFKVAGFHKPFRPHYSKKAENDYQYEQWAPLFDQYGLSLGLTGDTHLSAITYPIRPSQEPESYEGFIRDDQRGTMYVGEGSWGAPPREVNDNKPWTLTSGSFNQINWLQVFPEQDGKPAHIDIRTVITASKTENKKIVSYVENVRALSEDNLFAIPKNINLFAPEPHGAVITYPYQERSGLNFQPHLRKQVDSR